MKKILSIFLIGFIAVGILIPTHFASAATSDILDFITGATLSAILLPVLVLITTFCSFILIICGKLLDLIVQWSILDMSSVIGSGSALGAAILDSWGAIRDLSNIFFIFVLLYAAFNAMFNLSFGTFGKTVVNIIIVALLINFSMFFTKVVIDASNVVTTGFYQIIAESNKDVVVENQFTNIPGISSGRYTNLSAAYMRVLNIQTIFGTFSGIESFKATRMVIYSILGSGVMLVVAVILFSMAMMLISRFIVLLYLMVLSPAAILCIALPKLNGYFNKWLSSLLSQAFFAPVFFALIWIALRIGSEANIVLRNGSNTFQFSNLMDPDPSVGVTVVFSYILILGMTIAAMRAAKSISSSAAGFTAINTFVGGSALGIAAAGLRNSAGRLGANVAKDRDLVNRAAAGDIGARMKLATANWASSSSFDLRNVDTLKKTGLGNTLDMFGKGAGKGGFVKAVEEKSKAKADYAKKVYGSERPGDKDVDDAAKKNMEKELATLKKQAEEEQKEKRKLTANEAKSVSDKKNKEVKKYEDNALKKELDEFKKLKDARKKELDNAKNAKTDDERRRFADKADILAKNIEIAKENLDERRKDMSENDAEYIARREAAEDAKKEYDDKKKAIRADVKESEYSETIAKKIKEVKEGHKSSSQKRQEEYANRISSGIFGWRAVNKAAADKIKKQIKEKTKEKKLEDVMKEYAKEEQAQTQTPTTPPDANPPANPTT